MAQQTEQLIELMNHYADKGDLKNGRKVAGKLLDKTSARLKELSHIDINDASYRAVMGELNEIEFLTGSKNVST